MTANELRSTEKVRREAAQRSRGKIVAGSGRALEPRKLDQMVSLRLDPEVLTELRTQSQQLERTVSDILREAALVYLEILRSARVRVTFTGFETVLQPIWQTSSLEEALRSSPTYSEGRSEGSPAAYSKTA